MNWLDTETKAILRGTHQPKLAPPKAGEFALILLRKGSDEERLVRAIRRTNDDTEFKARFLARLPVPVTITPGVTEEEALFGQFELICCDAISVFIRSEVLMEQDDDYLNPLYGKVLESPEFRQVKVDILDVPATESGQKFVEQFLDIPLSDLKNEGLHYSALVPFKKARIMKHWAAGIEARVECDAIQEPPPEKIFIRLPNQSRDE
ncbi:MAG TPA: hypothetical protein VH251_12475 [Verrucomicrobiae bacterium]|nr:hypothetical protein [Verrucomicrobiae bacterium]